MEQDPKEELTGVALPPKSTRGEYATYARVQDLRFTKAREAVRILREGIPFYLIGSALIAACGVTLQTLTNERYKSITGPFATFAYGVAGVGLLIAGGSMVAAKVFARQERCAREQAQAAHSLSDQSYEDGLPPAETEEG